MPGVVRQNYDSLSVSGRRYLLLIESSCVLISTAAWVFYDFVWVHAQDYAVFYTASRSYLEGHLPLIFDGDAFTAQINERLSGWLSLPLDLHPWVYPPSFLLTIIPLGFLPFVVSYGLFIIGTFGFLNCAVRCHIPQGYQRWVITVGLLLSPATAFTVVVGQNSFLSTALMVGGFGLIRRAPMLAGALLGLLTCKPQLWLLVPVALFAAREWKVLGSTIVAAAVLTLASVVVLGIEPWREWLNLMLGPSPLYQRWLLVGRLYGQSAYTEAIVLGATARIASLLQALTIISGAILVWWCFRTSRMRGDLRLAVLLTATILVAPQVSIYDTEMVAVAALLFLCRALRDRFHPGDAATIIIVWGIELLDPPYVFRWGLMTPLVFCVFLAVVIARGRTDIRGSPVSLSPGHPEGRLAF